MVVNVENAAGGFGVTPGIADELFDQGAHVLTTGNHVWDKREIIEYMQSVPADSHDRPRRVLRPANYVAGTPGHGVYEGELPSGQTYAVINLQGRVFMANLEDPFRVADSLLKKIKAKVIFVDFHAEATSEKVALGWYLDGRVTAVIGTHTHVPTADQRVLPGRHGLPDRCGNERTLRQRHRCGKRADPCPLPQWDAGKIRGGQGGSAHVRGLDRVRRRHRPRPVDRTNHAGRSSFRLAE